MCRLDAFDNSSRLVNHLEAESLDRGLATWVVSTGDTSPVVLVSGFWVDGLAIWVRCLSTRNAGVKNRVKDINYEPSIAYEVTMYRP